MTVLKLRQNTQAQTDLKISGYASLFGQADMSGDIVTRGAFAASLLARTSDTLPLLFGHETQKPIGVWDRVFEDATGLFVSGRIFAGHKKRGNKRANHIARLVAEGAVSGLSIGYRPLRHTKRPAGGRTLLELDLWEVSVVAFPMLRGARIMEVGDNEFSKITTIKGSYLWINKSSINLECLSSGGSLHNEF